MKTSSLPGLELAFHFSCRVTIWEIYPSRAHKPLRSRNTFLGQAANSVFEAEHSHSLLLSHFQSHTKSTEANHKRVHLAPSTQWRVHATPAAIRIFKQSLLRHTAEQTSFSRLNSKGKQPKGRRKETPFHQPLINGTLGQEIRRK